MRFTWFNHHIQIIIGKQDLNANGEVVVWAGKVYLRFPIINVKDLNLSEQELYLDQDICK